MLVVEFSNSYNLINDQQNSHNTIILWDGPLIYVNIMNYGVYGPTEVCSLKPIYCTKVVSRRDIKES